MSISEGSLANAANFNAAFVSKTADGTVAGAQTFDKAQTLKQIATPANPASGYDKIYVKSDNKLYSLTSAGVETEIGAAAVTSVTSSDVIQNLGLSASVAANALTISLKSKAGTDPSGSDIVVIGTRNSTAATGTYNLRNVTAALSVVVSSGSTLGSVSAMANWVYVYAIDNAGTIELAVSGSKMFDNGSLVTTTAEGGAGAADSKTVLYSTTARSNVACRLIGRVKSTQATAGTWVTAPSELSLAPFENNSSRSMVRLNTANGMGSTNTKIRRFTTAVSNYGTAITYADSAANGASFTINEDGVYAVTYNDASSTQMDIGISLNSSQLTTSINSITITDALVKGGTGSASSGPGSTSWCGVLNAGDIIRAHSDGQTSGNTAFCSFTITQVSR